MAEKLGNYLSPPARKTPVRTRHPEAKVVKKHSRGATMQPRNTFSYYFLRSPKRGWEYQEEQDTHQRPSPNLAQLFPHFSHPITKEIFLFVPLLTRNCYHLEHIYYRINFHNNMRAFIVSCPPCFIQKWEGGLVLSFEFSGHHLFIAGKAGGKRLFSTLSGRDLQKQRL